MRQMRVRRFDSCLPVQDDGRSALGEDPRPTAPTPRVWRRLTRDQEDRESNTGRSTAESVPTPQGTPVVGIAGQAHTRIEKPEVRPPRLW
jgi:hypothetical protein